MNNRLIDKTRIERIDYISWNPILGDWNNSNLGAIIDDDKNEEIFLSITSNSKAWLEIEARVQAPLPGLNPIEAGTLQRANTNS